MSREKIENGICHIAVTRPNLPGPVQLRQKNKSYKQDSYLRVVTLGSIWFSDGRNKTEITQEADQVIHMGNNNTAGE